jgi:hypothetical protein
MRIRASAIFAVAAMVMMVELVAPRAARAGCGCTKPPPPLAAVRPSVAWAGADVTLFHAALVAGQRYGLRFDSEQDGGATAFAVATAVAKRDLADGVTKPQLVAALPVLPIGPVRIRVFAADATLIDVADDAFTVAPAPIGIPTGVGAYRFENYRAAVSRDGVVYLPLDFGDIQHARIFDAQAQGLPLRFESEDVAFWNVQGFLMQLLGQNMPGLFAIDSSSGPDSDVLRYSRHEFNTYFLQHGERASHAVDPTDGAWHLDGTHHIDHDHQVIAIDARLPNGDALPPGSTPRFTLVVTTSTLFSKGVVGRDSVLVDNEASVRSFDVETGQLGHEGHVASNGGVTVKNGSIVRGDATGDSFDLSGGGVVTGSLHDIDPPLDFLPVDAPSGLIELGDFVVSDPTSIAVGSYHATKLEVVGSGRLDVQNADGPVTIYVSGDVTVKDGGHIDTEVADPENFAIYLVGSGTAKFVDDSGFYGVVYGPDAVVEVDNGGTFAGAFVGGSMTVKNQSEVLYDSALHLNECTSDPLPLDLPSNLVLVPGEPLALPLDLVALLSGHRLRIGDRTVPLIAHALGGLGTEIGIDTPLDLPAGSDVEVTLVDPQGCRAWRTIIVPVARPRACGLLGIELAIVAPLARRVLRRRAR